MGIFREIPPTAGWPIYAKDFLGLLRKKCRPEELSEDFKAFLLLPYAQVTYSGTAALYFISETLKKLSVRRTVIIPSFVCPLVPLALQRAGLKVKVCDINRDNFDFDYRQLETLCLEDKDILAIIAVHLAGLPVDLDNVLRLASGRGIFVVEDCAQALGAQYKDKKVGTLADFAFFSLCRGKGLTIYEGGVMTAPREDFRPALQEAFRELSHPNRLSEAIKILELFGYWLFYRPQIFWFAYRLPQLYWNLMGNALKAAGEDFSLDFDTHLVSNCRNRLGHINFCRMEKEIAQQRQRAAYYIERLRGISGLKVVAENQNSRSNYPYLAIIFEDREKCRKAKGVLAHLGLGVSWIYLKAINDYPYLSNLAGQKETVNARFLAENTLTLSTSSFLKYRDMELLTDSLKRI